MRIALSHTDRARRTSLRLLLAVGLCALGACEQLRVIGRFPDGDVLFDGDQDGAGTDADRGQDADEDHRADTSPDGDGDQDHDTAIDGDVDFPPAAPCDWRSIEVPDVAGDPIVDLQIIDQDNWWLTADRSFDRTSLFVTTDGGATWEGRLGASDLAGSLFVGPGEHLWAYTKPFSQDILWASDNWGESFGERAETSQAFFRFFDATRGVSVDYSATQFCSTDDGGHSWSCTERHFSFVEVAHQIESLGEHVWIAGQGSLHNTGVGGLLCSHDSGQSWEEMGFANHEGDVCDAGPLYNVHAESAEEVWAVGDCQQMYHTIDGWESFDTVPDIDAFRIYDVSFLGDHGVAVHGDGVLESYDGGESWERTVHMHPSSCNSGRVERSSAALFVVCPDAAPMMCPVE